MNSRHRRLTAVVCSSGLAAGAIRLGTFAVKTISERRMAWERTLVQIARAESYVATLPRLEDSVRFVQNGLVRLAGTVLQSNSRADAHVELARIVTTEAGRSGGRVINLVPLDDSTRTGSLTRVSLRLEIEAGFVELHALATSLGMGAPFIGISSLDIENGNPLGPADAASTLRIEMVCSAWFMRRANG